MLLVVMTTSRAAAAAKGGRNEICVVACGLVSSRQTRSLVVVVEARAIDRGRRRQRQRVAGACPARSTHSPNEWERRRDVKPVQTPRRQTDQTPITTPLFARLQSAGLRSSPNTPTVANQAQTKSKKLSYSRDSERRRLLRGSGSFKVTDFGTNRKPVFDFLVPTNE